MKKCLIRQPVGIGDILFCQKIIKLLLKRGYEIWWPVNKEINWIKDYISNVNFCSLEDDFPLKKYYNLKNNTYIKEDNNIFIPLQSADEYYKNVCMMDAKYKFVGLSYDNWSKYLNFKRNEKKEKQLFNLLNLPEDFILVNKFFASPPNTQKCKHINLEDKNNVIELREIEGFSLFDWCLVFEKAAEIHTVDTSILYVLETLNITNKLYCYSRFDPPNFDNVSHLFNKPWHYVNNPEPLDFLEVEPKVLGRSQKGQDSYIDYIFNKIRTTNKYFVEFGAADGVIHSNTFYLRTEKGWDGLLLDCNESFPSNPSINLYNETLTMENICDIFCKYDVPKKFDFLSVDIDGNDYWLLSKIFEKYKPRVIMVEICARFSPDVIKVQKYDPTFIWKGDRWYGASPLAVKNLGKRFGYTAVYCRLDDMILIKDTELHQSNLNPEWGDVYPHALPDLYLSHGDYGIVEEQWQTPLPDCFSGKQYKLYDSYNGC
jgi:hypothetical protein